MKRAWLEVLAVGLAAVFLTLLTACHKTFSVGSTTAKDASAGGGDSSDKASAGSQAAKGSDQTKEAKSKDGTAAKGQSSTGDKSSAPPTQRPIDGRAAKLVRQGAEALRRVDHRTAQRRFDKALKVDRNAYPAMAGLGTLAARDGKAADAKRHFERALTVRADYAPAVQGLVAMHLRQGQVQRALDLSKKLSRAHPKNADLQIVRGQSLVDAGQPDKAWEPIRAALRLKERSVEARLVLARASLAQGRDELAVSILEQVQAIDDKSGSLHYLLGQIAEADGQPLKAQTEYQKAVELEPSHLLAQLALGRAYLRGGNYSGALERMTNAKALGRGLPEVAFYLGEAYRVNKRWRDAETSYKEALGLAPERYEIHFSQGLLYQSLAGEVSGLSKLDSLQKARAEFEEYRSVARKQRKKTDAVEEHLRDLERLISREKRRLEREARKTTEAKKS